MSFHIDVSDIVSFVIGTALSAYGIILTIQQNKKERISQTIDWNQLNLASKYVYKKLKESSFTPSIILCPGQKGGIFAQLILDMSKFEIPICTGFLISKEKNEKCPNVQKYITIETTKWYVFIPEIIKDEQWDNILIVDDFVMSGDFLYSLKAEMKKIGYNEQQIKSCSIATTNTAIKTKKSPDIYWKTVDSDNCYFPWGKAK